MIEFWMRKTIKWDLSIFMEQHGNYFRCKCIKQKVAKYANMGPSQISINHIPIDSSRWAESKYAKCAEARLSRVLARQSCKIATIIFTLLTIINSFPANIKITQQLTKQFSSVIGVLNYLFCKMNSLLQMNS